MKKFKLLLTLLFSLSLLVGCSGGKDTSTTKPSNPSEITKTELTTEVTDATKLTNDYEGKVFSRDGIGEVTFERHIDGDTTWFNDGVQSFSLRYYGINTPESTAKIEPWGLAASAFTKEKIHNAEKIVLERDAAEKQTGDRLLGLVWIKEKGKTDFYCLNLLIVEQAYSANQLFDKESQYVDAFVEAGANAKATKKRVHGEKDPNYDYSNEAKVVTVEEIYADFDNLRASAKQLVVYGVLTRFVPDGFYIRSLEPVDGKYSHIYCFTFGSTLGSKFKVGNAIKFYAKAGEFGGNPQLTDVKTSSLGSQRPQLIDNEIHPVENITLNSSTKLEDYLYSPVTVDLKVKKMGKPSDNGDVTVFCYFNGTNEEMNIRVPSELTGIYSEFFVKDKEIRVNGILNKFVFNADNPSEFTYQIALCLKENDTADITEIK